jgi:hypothetical protein
LALELQEIHQQIHQEILQEMKAIFGEMKDRVALSIMLRQSLRMIGVLPQVELPTGAILDVNQEVQLDLEFLMIQIPWEDLSKQTGIHLHQE